MDLRKGACLPASVRRTAAFLGALTLAAAGVTAAPPPAAATSPFVTRVGDNLMLHGEPFRFAGTNNYYLHYQSATARDNVLDKAAASGFRVVRTWGWFDTGTSDGSDPTAGSQTGVYLQYWDGSDHPDTTTDRTVWPASTQ